LKPLNQWLDEIGRRGTALTVVLGGGANGLSFGRSLGRRGIPVVLVDGERGVAGRSRFVRSETLRGPSEHPDEWIDLLQRIASQLSRPAVLFATNDTLTELVARHAAQLAESYRYLIPEAEIVEAIVDKGSQYQRAHAAGVPIPRTEFPESHDDIVRIAAQVAYPNFLKPHRSLPGRAVIEQKRKLVVVEDPSDLIDTFDRLATPDNPFLVQERVPGPDTSLFYYLGFWDDAGDEHSFMTAQKLRQYPAGIGDGSLVQTVHEREVVELSRKLLLAFGYRGLVNVEFKRDARDGVYRLIEINPRSVNFNQLAVSAGIDFPWIAYQYLVGDTRPAPATEYRDGVRYVHEDLDVRAFLAGRRSGELTWRSWTTSILGTRAWAIASFGDPLPFIHQTEQHLVGLRSRARLLHRRTE